MRNNKGQFKKGNSGGPGRPKRADEQILIDLWDNAGKKQFEKAVKAGKEWALKKLLDKLFGDKRQTELTGENNTSVRLHIDKLFDASIEK